MWQIIGNQWVNTELGNNGYTVTSNFYKYKITDYIDSDVLVCGKIYWLASNVIDIAYEGGEVSKTVFHGIRQVSSGGVLYRQGTCGTTESISTKAIRPVIVLDAKAQLVLSSDGTSYDIKL